MADATPNVACGPEMGAPLRAAADRAVAAIPDNLAKNQPQQVDSAAQTEGLHKNYEAQRAKIAAQNLPEALKEKMLGLLAQQEAAAMEGLKRSAQQPSTSPAEMQKAAGDLLNREVAAMQDRTASAVGCKVDAPEQTAPQAIKPNPALEAQRNNLQAQLDQLGAIDTAPHDYKITKSEIAAAVVTAWKDGHPNDVQLQQFRSYVGKALAMRQEVERVTSPENNDHSPRANFIRDMLAPALKKIRAGDEVVPAVLQARLDHVAGIGKNEKEQILDGYKYAVWLEHTLFNAADNITRTLEDNRFKMQAEAVQLGYKNEALATAQTELNTKIAGALTPEKLAALAANQKDANGKPMLGADQLKVIEQEVQKIPGLNPNNNPDIQRIFANVKGLQLEVGQMNEIAGIRVKMAKYNEYNLSDDVKKNVPHLEDLAQVLGVKVPSPAPQR